MNSEKRSVQFSVFLVKESIADSDEIINKSKCSDPIEVPISGLQTGELYIRNTFGKVPKWFNLFSPEVDEEKLGQVSNVSAAFLLEVSERYFVLSFGQGGRFLIKDDCCEERFGLTVALNSVDKNSFRCIDKKTLDTIQSHTRIQAAKETSPDQFGLDVEQDILRAIVGSPRDPNLGRRMTGAESLSLSAKIDLNDLPVLLNSYKTKFEDETYKSDYPWVHNISEVKKPLSVVEELDSVLIQKLQAADPIDLWLSIPEIIQWDNVIGFIYSSGRKIIHPDINLRGFLTTVSDKKEINLKLLHSRKVWCADADHNPVFREWKIYNCIYAEVDYDGRKYILSGGKWFLGGRAISYYQSPLAYCSSA